MIPTGEKKSIILTINFQPQQNFIGAVKDSLILNFKNQKEIVYKLRGLSTKALEGKNEPPLYDIVQLLDYNINLGWSGLSNTTNPKLQGDELSQTLFVKAGSIIPMGPKVQYATEKFDKPIMIKVYPGNDAEFVLYFDDDGNVVLKKFPKMIVTSCGCH